jgi:8-oxo-dGTP pyrophosphatase MutT (NUDIX family)
MEAPKFKNRPNQHIRYHYNDGCGCTINQDFFIGRSTAVVGAVFAVNVNGIFVLITKRSKKMRDEPNKFGMPCGYLDWNETRYEAMIREVYEETSLYLPDYKKYLLFNNNEKSIISKDNPEEDKRQNITEIYLTVLDFTENEYELPTDIENFRCKETELVRWMNVSCVGKGHEQWAFHHDETIKKILAYYNDNVITQYR